MERIHEPEVKLIDLWNIWRKAYAEALTASGKMSITPGQVRAERESYEKFVERLKKCKC